MPYSRQALRHLLSYILLKLLIEALTVAELLDVSRACSPEVRPWHTRVSPAQTNTL